MKRAISFGLRVLVTFIFVGLMYATLLVVVASYLPGDIPTPLGRTVCNVFHCTLRTGGEMPEERTAIVLLSRFASVAMDFCKPIAFEVFVLTAIIIGVRQLINASAQ